MISHYIMLCYVILYSSPTLLGMTSKGGGRFPHDFNLNSPIVACYFSLETQSCSITPAVSSILWMRVQLQEELCSSTWNMGGTSRDPTKSSLGRERRLGTRLTSDWNMGGTSRDPTKSSLGRERRLGTRLTK